MSVSMSFTISATNATEISQGIRDLAAILEASAREAGVDEAAPAVEQPQATPVPDPVAPAPTPAPAPAQPATQAPPPAPTITLEALRTKAVALAQAGKSEQLQGLLQQFGVARLTDLPVDKYAEFDAALGAL